MYLSPLWLILIILVTYGLGVAWGWLLHADITRSEKS